MSINSFTSFYDKFQGTLQHRVDDPRIDPPAPPEPQVIHCDCGCGRIIQEGEECIEVEGDFFTDVWCMLKAYGGRSGYLSFDEYGDPCLDID